MRDAKPIVRLVGLGIVLAVMTGCTTVVHAPHARRSEGLPSGNRGQSSSMVFSGPAVAAAMTRTPDWVRPEYARNNDNLAYAQPRALSAIDQWPQATRPTVTRQRRTTLSRTAQQIIIYTAPNSGRRGGRGGSYRGGRGHLYSPLPR